MRLGRARSTVVVDGQRLKELFNAPDSDLNFLEGISEDTDFRYTFQADRHDNYHIRVIRDRLTQNIPTLMPEIIDELFTAVEDEFESRASADGKLKHPRRFTDNRMET